MDADTNDWPQLQEVLATRENLSIVMTVGSFGPILMPRLYPFWQLHTAMMQSSIFFLDAYSLSSGICRLPVFVPSRI